MQIRSDAIQDGKVPVRYSRDGENMSPPLSWSGVPDRAKELVLIFENLTPQTQEPFAQWIVYGIPPAADGLPEGFRHKRDPEEPAEALHGKNDIGNVGYDGPLGTAGRTFRYRFRLLALARELELRPGADRETVLRTAADDVLDEAELAVDYERPR